MCFTVSTTIIINQFYTNVYNKCIYQLSSEVPFTVS